LAQTAPKVNVDMENENLARFCNGKPICSVLDKLCINLETLYGRAAHNPENHHRVERGQYRKRDRPKRWKARGMGWVQAEAKLGKSGGEHQLSTRE